jgi:hypothetical protein
MDDNLTELERMVLADLGLYGKVSDETATKWLEDFFKDNQLLHVDGGLLLVGGKIEKAEKHLARNSLSALLELASGPDIFWERYRYQACHDQITYKAAIFLGEKWLVEGSHIPQPMRSFFASVLAGRIKEPLKQGPKEGATAYRNWLICSALEQLRIIGIPPTKNTEPSIKRADKKSGCELVALVLKGHGFLRLSSHTVERIWKSREEVNRLVENKAN